MRLRRWIRAHLERELVIALDDVVSGTWKLKMHGPHIVTGQSQVDSNSKMEDSATQVLTHHVLCIDHPETDRGFLFSACLLHPMKVKTYALLAFDYVSSLFTTA
jgi:hypothetical protein